MAQRSRQGCAQCGGVPPFHASWCSDRPSGNVFTLLTGRIVVRAPIAMTDERAEELIAMYKPDVEAGLKRLAQTIHDDARSAGLDVTWEA